MASEPLGRTNYVSRTVGIVLASAALAGCGSGAELPPPPPRLSVAIAEPLAARSDQVVELLVAGDACGALEEARRLQQDAVQAINEGRVPAAFQEHLGTAVNDLAGRIQCIAPPEEDDEERGRGKGKDKGKGKKHGEGDG
jgi:hypothetical protein